ncbi:MAG: hypothetical protein ACRECR_03610, partial [Thermoplasmata archaeon]
LLLARLEGFLREEADLCARITAAYARWARITPAAPGPGGVGDDPHVCSLRGGAEDPTLREIEATRQTLDLVIRPDGYPAAFRTGLLRTLGNLLRRSVHIRLITDATLPDLRFRAALAREGGDRGRLLLQRHLAPVGAHYYISDRRLAVRVPVLGLPGRPCGIALWERDHDRLRTQCERFEALWTEASAPFGPARSTRAYAWNQTAALLRTSPAIPPRWTTASPTDVPRGTAPVPPPTTRRVPSLVTATGGNQ